MITGKDIYQILTAFVPLYVAMIAAYVSVRWGKVFTADQCAGVNAYVAFFAGPILSFKFISSSNLYHLDYKFLAADCLQKLAVLTGLLLWHIFSAADRIEWVITLFSTFTLPNTLVVGIPLLRAMYGNRSGSLMVQIVVLQCIIWNTLLISLFEYRGAKILISSRFPATTGRIASIRVDSDVVSMSGVEDLEAEVAKVGDDDGKVHVVVRRSMSLSSSRRDYMMTSLNHNYCNNEMTPRVSNMSGVDVYSIQTTPRGSSFGTVATDLQGGYLGKAPSLRKSSFVRNGSTGSVTLGYPLPNGEFSRSFRSGYSKELHMFGQSPSKVSDAGGSSRVVPYIDPSSLARLPENDTSKESLAREMNEDLKENVLENGHINGTQVDMEGGEYGKNNQINNMPPMSVVTKLIVVMVWRQVIRNPNTYGWVLGLIWSLISFRWNVKMPIIVAESTSILSKTGLGMIMFSIGLFMALQPRIIACGIKKALMSMGGRFLVGPAVIAVTSVAIGLRGDLLRISIVQAALPQSIVPFVFAKQYNVHPDILSTAVIFGLLLSLPVTIVYYILLGL